MHILPDGFVAIFTLDLVVETHSCADTIPWKLSLLLQQGAMLPSRGHPRFLPHPSPPPFSWLCLNEAHNEFLTTSHAESASPASEKDHDSESMAGSEYPPGQALSHSGPSRPWPAEHRVTPGLTRPISKRQVL